MPNGNDGKPTSNTKNGSYKFAGQALSLYENGIQKTQEDGSFTQKEQEQVGKLMKSVKERGGFGNIEADDVRELLSVLKILGSKDDKTIMVKDDIANLLSNISKKEKVEDKYDGKNWSYKFAGQALNLYESYIQKAQEDGSFTEKEQEQVRALIKTAKNNGGLSNMQVNDVRELLRVIKILGSKEDKTIMVKDDITDLLSNISKKGKGL